MEVFIAFTKDDDFFLLKQTLEAWDQPGFEPVATWVKPSKYQIGRRVMADKLSKDPHYLISDLGCGPGEKMDTGNLFRVILPKDGLIAFPNESNPQENRVALCVKGSVEKWPQWKEGDYTKEHAEAVRLSGKVARVCPNITYRPILAS